MDTLEDYIEIMKEVAYNLVNTQQALPYMIIGCTEEEIISLEKKIESRLPLAFKAYLYIMGHCQGSMWDNVGLYEEMPFSELPNFHFAICREFSELNYTPPFPFFTYYMDQDTWFILNLDSDEDPKVYKYESADWFPSSEKDDILSRFNEHGHFSTHIIKRSSNYWSYEDYKMGTLQNWEKSRLYNRKIRRDNFIKGLKNKGLSGDSWMDKSKLNIDEKFWEFSEKVFI